MDPPWARDGRQAVDVARACAAAAREIVVAASGQTSTTAKGRGNVVTAADVAVETRVTTILREAYSDHEVLAEETAATARSDRWMWVVDPIDGTKNFAQGIPHFAFALALCYASEPVLALTVHPLLNDEFLAVAGKGTTLNGSPVRVSGVASVADAVVGLDLGYNDARARRQLELAAHLWPGMQSLRISGSAALGFAYAAAGKWDLFIHSDLMPWDMAGGLLLVREAGGVVTNRDGSPATIDSTAVVAGSPSVHADFMRLAKGLPWAG